MTEGPRILRWYAAGVAAATLVGALSMAGVEYTQSQGPSARPAAQQGVRPMTRQVQRAEPRDIDCAKVKCIALTFDDGPMPDTGRLLKMLKARNVRATFFLVGQMVVQHPELVRQELADGHELGDHSWSHADLPTLSDAGIRSQLSRTQEAVRKAAGVSPQVFRPPYGAINGRVTAVARQFGLPQILWEVDPLDWRDRNTPTVERRVVREAHRGDIVLMHDIHPTTVSAVPEILDQLSQEGFTFVTVSELFGNHLVPGKRYERLEQTAVSASPTITPPPQALRAR